MRIYLTTQRRIWHTAHRHFREAMQHRQCMRHLVVTHGTAGLPSDSRDLRWIIGSVGREWYARYCELQPIAVPRIEHGIRWLTPDELAKEFPGPGGDRVTRT